VLEFPAAAKKDSVKEEGKSNVRRSISDQYKDIRQIQKTQRKGT